MLLKFGNKDKPKDQGSIGKSKELQLVVEGPPLVCSNISCCAFLMLDSSLGLQKKWHVDWLSKRIQSLILSLSFR
jgi:hypothetical protein